MIGNTILNNAGRGVSVHGLNAIIQGNNIQHVSAAISVGGDTGYQEDTFPSNVTVSSPVGSLRRMVFCLIQCCC